MNTTQFVLDNFQLCEVCDIAFPNQLYSPMFIGGVGYINACPGCAERLMGGMVTGEVASQMVEDFYNWLGGIPYMDMKYIQAVLQFAEVVDDIPRIITLH